MGASGREKGGRRLVFESGLHDLGQEVERGPTLLSTGGHRRPDPFAPPTPPLPARALRDLAIDHDVSDRLFSQVVGGLDSRCRNELEVGGCVLLETDRDVLGRLRRGVFRSVPDLITAIEGYIGAHNEDPKPFVWKKTVEEILAKVGRARAALDNAATG